MIVSLSFIEATHFLFCHEAQFHVALNSGTQYAYTFVLFVDPAIVMSYDSFLLVDISKTFTKDRA